MKDARTVALASLIALLAVAGCASPTPYKAMDGRFGYSERKIEQNTYRVVFNGNEMTSRETVEDYLLYRAAELTLQQGYDHFEVVAAETDATRGYYSSPTTFGYYRPRFSRFPYYAYGYPWAFNTLGPEVSIRETRRFMAEAYIVMGEGTGPESSRVFDASEVQVNLAPVIERP